MKSGFEALTVAGIAVQRDPDGRRCGARPRPWRRPGRERQPRLRQEHRAIRGLRQGTRDPAGRTPPPSAATPISARARCWPSACCCWCWATCMWCISSSVRWTTCAAISSASPPATLTALIAAFGRNCVGQVIPICRTCRPAWSAPCTRCARAYMKSIPDPAKSPRATRTRPAAPSSRPPRWRKPLPAWSSCSPPSAATRRTRARPTRWPRPRPKWRNAADRPCAMP